MLGIQEHCDINKTKKGALSTNAQESSPHKTCNACNEVPDCGGHEHMLTLVFAAGLARMLDDLYHLHRGLSLRSCACVSVFLHTCNAAVAMCKQ